jgi:hypothetical protein
LRDEVNKIASHYLAEGSPRELNLSHRDRVAVMKALKVTTHPSALAPVISLIEIALRNQSHPNFVRWTICNGNRPKVLFVRGMGTFFSTIAIALTITLCLSHLSRWWRIFVFIPYFMGITILTAAYKGLCILLHHNGNMRGVRPWEDITAPNKDEEDAIDSKIEDEKSEYSDSHEGHPPKSKWLDTFGSRNEFSNEPWVMRWKHRPFIQRFFEPTTKVYEEGIRIMQDTIVTQSQLLGLAGATIMTIGVTALPKGNYF